MQKKLSEMTKEELWSLFPIRLTAHNPEWREWYAREAARLAALLNEAQLVRISHIGSTAVETIWAKPTVDVLVEFVPGCDLGAMARLLEAQGYCVMSRGEGRVSLNKGYTENGYADEVFHIHLRIAGDNDELYFRDYLIDHPEFAREYEALKLSLWKRYEFDRDAYTEAKAPFVRRFTELARRAWPNRY